jgi:Ca2+-binding RTX toxin-like protein
MADDTDQGTDENPMPAPLPPLEGGPPFAAPLPPLEGGPPTGPAPLPPLSVYQGDESNNEIDGSPDNDTMFGLGGDDTLSGLDGHDILEGGPGADILRGNRGNDTLTGGPDDGDAVNTFRFSTRDGDDTITDFSQADQLTFGGKGPSERSVYENVGANADGDAVLTYSQTTITLIGISPSEVTAWAEAL